MADLYVDANVSVHLKPLLLADGHAVTMSSEIGLDSTTDDRQMLEAARRRAVLITHNRNDFRLLHGAWFRWSGEWGVSHAHPGIIVLEPARPPILYAPLRDILGAITDFTNTMHEWRIHGGWQQRPYRP